MLEKHKHKPKKTPENSGEEDDASTDRTSLDGEEMEEANASGQDNEANIIAALHLLREDFSISYGTL